MKYIEIFGMFVGAAFLAVLGMFIFNLLLKRDLQGYAAGHDARLPLIPKNWADDFGRLKVNVVFFVFFLTGAGLFGAACFSLGLQSAYIGIVGAFSIASFLISMLFLVDLSRDVFLLIITTKHENANPSSLDEKS